MKKIISLLLSVIICFSACSVASLAANDSLPSRFIYRIDELCDRFVSVAARAFNLIFGTDEDDIDKAAENEKAWTAIDKDYSLVNIETTLEAEAWIMNELTFVSQKSYADSFNDVTLDLILTGNGRKYTVPGFWDGGNTWKLRFVCPSEGTWYYQTVCSDEDNAVLHNRTGKIICKGYSGELDIYKNGFVTTDYGKKYFTYDDGTPFLYLGDTHWSLGDETQDMVKTICETRYAQGFTVFQSEPIGAKFHLENGVTEDDMAGFADYDAKFKTIAENGLVHANAEFFYPSDMNTLISTFGGYSEEYTEIKIGRKKVKFYYLSDSVKEYLEKLTRYWVARYSAFPVLWTLGQEVDDDFYWSTDNHSAWSYANNPYKLIAEYIDKYDCYDHPISAHQENTGATSAYGSGEGATDKCKVYNKNVSASAFRNIKAHTWYAAQWSPSKTSQFDFGVTKDYWFNSQGKPVVNYEGAYCGLWTKDFGSRMQGWCSYLNGMYGYGWGGHDTWSYTNTYDEENTSTDGVDTITSQEKIDATWLDSLAYESGFQCGYMIDFLGGIEWYNLVPRFNNKSYFVPGRDVLYSYASNEANSEIVIYFYSFSNSSIAENPNSNDKSGTATGTVGNLEKKQAYTYKWFNPVTGEYTEEGSFTSSCVGTYYIGKKADTDMVLYIEKQ